MQVSSLAEIKRELKEHNKEELIAYCLRVAKFKKDNKELLNYLLFEAHDEESFKQEVITEMTSMFDEVNLSSVYFAKKTIRKILRFVTKQIKYSGYKQTEVELLIGFCKGMRSLPLPFHESKVMINLYQRQLFKISKALATLNEDLQFDYQADFDSVSQPIANARLY